MNKSVLVTGIPGTGKTVIAEELKKLGYTAFDMEEVDGLFGLYHKETGEELKDYSEYKKSLNNIKKYDWNINVDRLKNLMKENSGGIVFYCGTGGNILEVISLFDLTIMLTINDDAIRHRLTHRSTNDFGNTSEVQEWVISWKDWFEDGVKEFNPIVVDANKSLEEVTSNIIELVNA